MSKGNVMSKPSRTAAIIAAVIVTVATVSATVPAIDSEPLHTGTVITESVTHGPVLSLRHWDADNEIDPVVIVTPVVAPEVIPEPLCAPGGTEYTVRSGDTLSIIAGLCGTTVDVLATANGLGNPFTIYPGDVLQRQGVKVVEPPAAQAVVFPSAGAANYGPGIETVIAFAMAQLGDWYVYGANGPDVWDCSSLTQQSFGAAGVSLTRTTYTQINQGTPVSRGSVQRGDLVFPSDGHVGIALDNGTMIHAPQSGEQVKIGPIYAFYAARRFF